MANSLEHGSLHVIRLIVAVALAAVLGVTGVIDVFLIAKFGPDLSITSLVVEASKQYPAIPLFAGMLIGHLFL